MPAAGTGWIVDPVEDNERQAPDHEDNSND